MIDLVFRSWRSVKRRIWPGTNEDSVARRDGTDVFQDFFVFRMTRRINAPSDRRKPFVHREQQFELLDPRRALDLVNAGDAAGDLGTPVIAQRLFRFEQVNADIIARRRFARIIFLDQSRHRPEEWQSLLQIPDDFIMTQSAMELYD